MLQEFTSLSIKAIQSQHYVAYKQDFFTAKNRIS